MALEFVGFGDQEDEAKEMLKLALSSIGNAYADLVAAAKNSTQVALDGFASKNATFRKRYATWFGALTPANVGVVKNKLSTMNTVISKGTVTIRYNGNPVPIGHVAYGHVPCVPGTNAVAYWWAPAPPGGGGGLVLKHATYQEATTQQFYMAMCASFFKGATLAGSVGAVRNQSKNGTLIHEISHLAAGTGDHNVALNGVVVVANGKAAALELAKTNAAAAIDNAENYGYFCDEYHT